MDDKTLEALRGSIAKWEGIVAGTMSDRGNDNCPLCKIFNPTPRPETMALSQVCVGCPVHEKTGTKWCSNTPYDDLESIAEEHGSGSEEYQEGARAELDFLKGLLPAAPQPLVAEQRPGEK